MRRSSITVVYGAALLQGLTVVAFPASATVLRGSYGLDDHAYGSLFLPQMACTIAGSLIGAALARRIGLRALLALATSASTGAMLALGSVAALAPSMHLATLLAGTGLMGLGFGLAAAPLNAYPARLIAGAPDAALVALHTAMGAGFALGPLAVSAAVAASAWPAFPLALAALGALLLAGVFAVRLPPDAPAAARGPAGTSARGSLIVFVAIAVLYAFAEGTFASWAAVFLAEDRRVAPELAALALSAFWAALALGRLAVATVVSRVGAARVWCALLVSMALAFVALPLARGAWSGIALFALAGLACSAFFPLTVGLAARRSGDPARTSSILVAALMIGVGSASFALGALRERVELSTLYRLSALYPALALALAWLALRARPVPSGAVAPSERAA